jgi:Na+-driven multidrug efflux pump
MNKILIQFNTTATAVFGVYFKLQSFIFMPIFGISNGIVPIVAYNFGAKNKERLMKTMNFGIIYSLSIMFLGVVIFQTIPERLLSLFNASEDMLQIGVPALRIISLGFLLAGYNIIVVSVFQALGNGLYSMLVSVVRQLVVILPVAFFLAKVGGLTSVWWSLPIAEAVSIVMCFFFFRRTYRSLIVKLEQ